eukprot:4315797-Amphidinium_carterae.2
MRAGFLDVGFMENRVMGASEPSWQWVSDSRPQRAGPSSYHFLSLSGVGWNNTVFSDKGTEFTADTLRKYLREKGIAMYMSVPYQHASNGIAENLIRLRKVRNQETPSWRPTIGLEIKRQGSDQVSNWIVLFSEWESLGSANGEVRNQSLDPL